MQHLGVFVAPDGKCKYSAPSAQAYGDKIGVPLPDVNELKRMPEDKTQKSTVHTEKKTEKSSLIEVSKPIDNPNQVGGKQGKPSFFKKVLSFLGVGLSGETSSALLISLARWLRIRLCWG